MTNGTNGWNEWSRYVLKAVEDNSKENEKILAELRCLKAEINKLNTALELLKLRTSWRAAFWGVLGGALPIAMGIITKVAGFW